MLLDDKMYKDRLYSFFFDGCVKYKYINICISIYVYQYKYISNIIK